MNRFKGYLLALLISGVMLFVACMTKEEGAQVLNMKITEKNDSLLTFDSLIVTVHSKDGTFSQEVFHGVLRDPKQVANMPLDPRAGTDYTVSILGYKDGKIGVNKEVIFVGSGAQSTDIPIKVEKPETVVVIPNAPEILSPSDTSIAEGDSLRFRVNVKNGWSVPTTLTLKDAISGAALDTAGRDPGDGYFTWRPNLDQGRSEPYAVTFVYASATQKVEKITRVKVTNVNRAPKLSPVADQKAKENELLSFNVVALDPDHDSLTLTAIGLPVGATFSVNTFSWKPSEGQAGNYSVKFHVFDGKDSDEIAVLITVGNVDVPPPVTVNITSPAHDTIVNITPITIYYTVNGTPLQLKYALKDGKNRVRIDTTILNRSGFDTVLITLDTIRPGKPIVNGASPVRTRTPSWSWSSSGNGSGLYRYGLDIEDFSGSAVTSDTTYTPSKDQDIGTHTLFVQERDAAGNWSLTGKRAVRIDTTRPLAPQVNVVPASPTNNSRPSWSWSALGDDLSGLFRYKLDTNDFRAGGVETRLTTYTPDKDLKEGTHTLYVQQQDSAGNWSLSGGSTLSLDLTAPLQPKLTLAQASPTNNSKPIWNLATGGGGIGLYRVKLDDTNFTLNPKSGTFTSFTPDTALKDGIHTLYAQERDSAGNWSKTSSLVITVDLTPPTAPKVSSPTSKTTNTKPTWTWHTGGGGNGVYRYQLDNPAIPAGTTASDTLYKPASALTEGVHTLYVQERDAAGNWSTASSLAIRIYGQTGYAAGRFGKLLKTTDAGASWKILASGTETNLNAIHFTDLNTGYAAGSDGLVLKTTNGGTKWDSLNTGASVWLYCIYFVDANTGFAGGDDGSIIKTTNAGATWRLRNQQSGTTIRSIYFTDSKTGYAAGGDALFKTTDGGDTWLPIQNTGGHDFQAIYFTDVNTGYAAGSGVYKTTNAGGTWGATSADDLNSLSSLFFADSQNGYAVGTGGTVLKTTNAGATWKSVASGTTTHLYSVYFTDVNTGYSVGDNGSMFKTIDAGENWVAMPGDAEKSVFFP